MKSKSIPYYRDMISPRAPLSQRFFKAYSFAQLLGFSRSNADDPASGVP